VIRLRIDPIAGTDFAENKEQAKQLREDHILPALAAGDHVYLDFSRVSSATQSFIHALISEAVRRGGEEYLNRLHFENCSGDVRQLVLTVVEYTLMAADAASGLKLDQANNGEFAP
jgi:STAS-like domain of unknown function (DUF4325)